MARILLCLAAACCCGLALLLVPPAQGRPSPGTGSDHHLLKFPEPHSDAAEPIEQPRGAPVKKKKATPAAGGVVTPELRSVPGGANPLHNHGNNTRQDEKRTPPEAAAEGSVARPEMWAAPWGANPLHN